MNVFRAPLSQHENSVCVWFFWFLYVITCLLLKKFGRPWAVFLYISWHFEISPLFCFVLGSILHVYRLQWSDGVFVHACMCESMCMCVISSYFSLCLRSGFYHLRSPSQQYYFMSLQRTSQHNRCGWLGIENQLPFLAKKWLAVVLCLPLCPHYCSIINKHIPCLSVVCK